MEPRVKKKYNHAKKDVCRETVLLLKQKKNDTLFDVETSSWSARPQNIAYSKEWKVVS
jgi:hypothetical protein